jgi:hypothetical protein
MRDDSLQNRWRCEQSQKCASLNNDRAERRASREGPICLVCDSRIVLGSAFHETNALAGDCILRGSDSLFREFPAHLNLAHSDFVDAAKRV